MNHRPPRQPCHLFYRKEERKLKKKYLTKCAFQIKHSKKSFPSHLCGPLIAVLQRVIEVSQWKHPFYLFIFQCKIYLRKLNLYWKNKYFLHRKDHKQLLCFWGTTRTQKMTPNQQRHKQILGVRALQNLHLWPEGIFVMVVNEECIQPKLWIFWKPEFQKRVPPKRWQFWKIIQINKLPKY